MTGDGKADVLIHDQVSGGWWIGRSTGTGFAVEQWAQGFGTGAPDRERIFVADVTGDGKADVLIHDRVSGGWWIGRSTGAGFAVEPWASGFGTGSAEREQVFVVDVTGDGRADVVIHNRASGGWWVGRSTGSSFAIEQWASGLGTGSADREEVFVGGTR